MYTQTESEIIKIINDVIREDEHYHGTIDFWVYVNDGIPNNKTINMIKRVRKKYKMLKEGV